jgi:hypothetical protein
MTDLVPSVWALPCPACEHKVAYHRNPVNLTGQHLYGGCQVHDTKIGNCRCDVSRKELESGLSVALQAITELAPDLYTHRWAEDDLHP